MPSHGGSRYVKLETGCSSSRLTYQQEKTINRDGLFITLLDLKYTGDPVCKVQCLLYFSSQCLFNHSPEGKEFGEWLLSHRQGKQSAMELTLTFCTLAAGSTWNKTELKAAYLQGLNQDILTELACCDDQVSLDLLNDLSIHLGYLLKNQGGCKTELNPIDECHF